MVSATEQLRVRLAASALAIAAGAAALAGCGTGNEAPHGGQTSIEQTTTPDNPSPTQMTPPTVNSSSESSSPTGQETGTVVTYSFSQAQINKLEGGENYSDSDIETLSAAVNTLARYPKVWKLATSFDPRDQAEALLAARSEAVEAGDTAVVKAIFGAGDGQGLESTFIAKTAQIIQEKDNPNPGDTPVKNYRYLFGPAIDPSQIIDLGSNEIDQKIAKSPNQWYKGSGDTFYVGAHEEETLAFTTGASLGLTNDEIVIVIDRIPIQSSEGKIYFVGFIDAVYNRASGNH